MGLMQSTAPNDTEREEDRYEALLRRAWHQRIPLTVLWELTGRCNLRCKHCYVPHDAAWAELNTAEGVAVLDQLAEAGTLYLTFSGGEPLLRPDFFTLAEAAREREFALRIFTNGTMVDEQAADRIAALSPLSVEVSIYGYQPATHDAIAGLPGAHAGAVRALELLGQRGVRTVAKTTVMRPNLDEFDDLWAWATEHADRFVYNVMIMPGKEGRVEPLEMRLSRQELRRFHQERLEGQQRPPAETPPQAPLCLAGFSIAAIGPTGTVYPCVAMPAAAGELRQESFGAIWQHSPGLASIRSFTLADSECRSCEVLSLCTRCPGLALLESGDVLGAAPGACVIAEARREALQNVADEEGIGARGAERRVS